MPIQRLLVPDISCDHCKSAIESEVGSVANVESVTVSVDERVVEVAGEASADSIVNAISRAGYSVA